MQDGALALTVVGCGLATRAFSGGLSVHSVWLRVSATHFIPSLENSPCAIMIPAPSAYTMLFAAIGVLSTLQPVQAARLVFSSPQTVIMALCGGVLCTVLPYLLYTKGLTRVDAGKASIVACVEPVVAALVGMLLFGEPLDVGRLGGMALVLAAIVLLNLPVSHRTRTAS